MYIYGIILGAAMEVIKVDTTACIGFRELAQKNGDAQGIEELNIKWKLASYRNLEKLNEQLSVYD